MSSPTLPTALSVPAKSRPTRSDGPSPVESEAWGSSAKRLRYLIFSVLAVGGLTLDLATKHYTFAWRGWQQFGQAWWIAEPYFGIQTAVNQGAVFGSFAGYRLVFVLLSFVALGVIGYFLFVRKRLLDLWLTTALGLVTGGILGNLYDRLGFWHTAQTPAEELFGVRDWILFRLPGVPLFDPWPNFNIADCCLVVGACLLALHSLYGEPKEKSSDLPPKADSR